MEEIAAAVEAGSSLSEAVSVQIPALPDIFRAVVSSGEAGGDLDLAFARLAEHFEKEDAVAQKVRSALAYPKVVVTMAVLVMTFMLAVILPKFGTFFASLGASLPGITLFVIAVSHFVTRFWWLLLLLFFGLTRGFAAWSRTESGRRVLDPLMLRLPIFGELVSKRALGRFARTLAVLLQAGVPIMEALQVVRQTVGNTALAAVVDEAAVNIRSGRGLTEPLRHSPYFPAMVTEMMGVGEETGSMEAMLLKVADFYDKDVDSIVGRLTSMIEPVVIVGLGAVIGFLIVSIVLPMFKLFTLVHQ